MPCVVGYDVVVHQETSGSDADFFTTYKEVIQNIKNLITNLLLQLTGRTHLPGQYVDSPLLTSSLIDQFRGLPRSLIEKLYEIYFDDFLLFNYSIDEFIEAADEPKEIDIKLRRHLSDYKFAPDGEIIVG